MAKFTSFKIPNYNNPKTFVLVFILLSNYHPLGVPQEQLRVGFYSQTCPNAESIIKSVVQEAILSESRNAAVLLRLQFHDCFVQGCDGSILIDNGEDSERNAFAHQGVGGFETIEKAKAQLEGLCPGVVSCADIVALAARDAVFLSNGPSYEVPTGRRDGRVSSLTLAEDMPDVSDSIQLLKSKFMEKGLSDKDLVLLSSAPHTIGTTACFFMKDRLYNFTPSGGSDPAINPQFLPKLKAECPFDGDDSFRIPLDPVSEKTFDDQILHSIRDGFAVIESDARLYDDDKTKQVIDSYINGSNSPILGPFFKPDFAESMVKMGRIGVMTGSEGEIRRVCSKFN